MTAAMVRSSTSVRFMMWKTSYPLASSHRGGGPRTGRSGSSDVGVVVDRGPAGRTVASPGRQGDERLDPASEGVVELEAHPPAAPAAFRRLSWGLSSTCTCTFRCGNGNLDVLPVEAQLEPAAALAGGVPLRAGLGPDERADDHGAVTQGLDARHFDWSVELRGPLRIGGSWPPRPDHAERTVHVLLVAHADIHHGPGPSPGHVADHLDLAVRDDVSPWMSRRTTTRMDIFSTTPLFPRLRSRRRWRTGSRTG